MESGAQDQVAEILAGLAPGADSENNRSSFAATFPVLDEFPVPETPTDEVCINEQEYADRYTVATSENAFVAAFAAYCDEDPANCEAEM